MRILVTGAKGFIGQHLCQQLLASNHEILALSHSKTQDKPNNLLRNPNYHSVNGNICILEEIMQIMQTSKVEAIVHLAAYAPYGHIESLYNTTLFDTNVRGTLNVLQSAIRTNCTNFIYASTRDVYGTPKYLPIDEIHPVQPVNFYGLTKLHGEHYCEFYAKHYGIHVITLRYAGVYGPGKNRGAIYNFIQAVLKKQPPNISSNGIQTRDFIYIGDVVSATVKALSVINKIDFDVFNIGSGIEMSLNELAIEIVKLLGMDKHFDYTTDYSTDRFILDITKAREILGFQSRPVGNAISEFAQFIKRGEQ